MKRCVIALAALVCAGLNLSGQETIKDRKSFIPNRKQAAVPGKTIGILLTDGQAILSTEGRSGPADQLVFSTGGNSYRWVYVPTQGQPMIQNLQVPVGDKGEKAMYAALNLANPPSVLPWAIKTPYTLVEVEINDRRGSPAGDSFVGTNFRVLDGTKNFPLQIGDVVKQVKALYAEYVGKQQKTIDAAMKDAADKSIKDKKATGPRETKDLMYVTWMTDSSTMRVLFKTTITDGAYEFIKQGGPGPVLPPRKIGQVSYVPDEFVLRAKPVGPINLKVGTTFGIEFGRAYVIDKKGDVIRTEDLPIESFSQDLRTPFVRPPGPIGLPPAPPIEKK